MIICRCSCLVIYVRFLFMTGTPPLKLQEFVSDEYNALTAYLDRGGSQANTCETITDRPGEANRPEIKALSAAVKIDEFGLDALPNATNLAKSNAASGSNFPTIRAIYKTVVPIIEKMMNSSSRPDPILLVAPTPEATIAPQEAAVSEEVQIPKILKEVVDPDRVEEIYRFNLDTPGGIKAATVSLTKDGRLATFSYRLKSNEGSKPGLDLIILNFFNPQPKEGKDDDETKPDPKALIEVEMQTVGGGHRSFNMKSTASPGMPQILKA